MNFVTVEEQLKDIVENTHQDHGKVVSLQHMEDMPADDEYEYYLVQAKFEDGFELTTGVQLEKEVQVLN